MCELKQRMPYAEFVEQLAYYRLEPWGDDWAQTRALSASAVSASPKFRTIDLKPYFPKPPKQQSPDHIFGFFKQLAIDAEARRKMNGNQRL